MRWLLAGAAALIVSAVSAEAKEPREDKVICKRQQDADTGSHLGFSKRVCRKASEWRELEEGTEQTIQIMRDRGSRGKLAPSMGGSPQ
jgi:hypothetical protein